MFAEFVATGAPLSALFISFLVYSFAGWLYESTICALANYGRFANSGFLLGPCCPIYGAGALACWFLLRGIPGVVAQFVAAALVCSVLEYSVGAMLERLTGARFWDYSKFPFNIKGRVCLYGAMLFGAGAVVICRAAEPSLLAALQALAAVACACAGVLVLDAAFALASWRQLSLKLELLRDEMADKINESLEDASSSMLDRVPAAALDTASELKARSGAVNSWLAEMSDGMFESVREKVEMPAFIAEGGRGLRLVARRMKNVAQRAEASAPVKLKTMMTRRELRFFNAFPEIKLKSYEGVIRATNLKERARELFYRK
ncbi:putative ABC transporter permease [Collinsella tanakaei]|uniref:putative ABC transporter permease n=1 Tax=Collinsella tanakaei TaxID=626935 RepID=UPI003AB8A77E